jgi:hypothetical protein
MKQNANSSPMRRSTVQLYGRWTLLVLTILVAVCLGASYFDWRSPAKAQPAPRRGPLVVRGYIATALGAGQDTLAIAAAVRLPERDVYLPNISVFLRNASSNDESKSVVTDLSGRFTLIAPSPGRYRVCWKARGFESDCAKDIISVTAPVFLSTVRIRPDRGDKTTVIFGNVKMKDGTRARLLEPLANINSFARVELLDAGGNLIQEAYVNNFDEYLLPHVPSRTAITLRARIEGATREQRILPAANIGAASFHPINLVINNSQPRLEPIVATDSGGQRVKVARPGQTVLLKERSSDRDGDPLKFKWQAADGSGTLGSTTAPSVEWKLPNGPGLYSVRLIAWDKKGGYAISDLSLATNNEGIPFSGQVDGTDSPAIVDAEVEVNGKQTTTNGRGLFSLKVPDAKRFVLNIRKPGYGLVSRIYDDSVNGGQWTMTRATTQRFDPKGKISVTDRRDKRNCPGPEGDRLDWRRYANLQPQWQDGKGNVITAPKYSPHDVILPKPRQSGYDCGPGASVEIPPNALQDERGRAATAPVDISIATIDLRSPEQMPGDYTVRRPDGTTRVMESYGAVSIDLRSGTSRLNLKSGMTAKVTLPVDPGQLAAGGTPPATIPLLSYDERKGVWVQEGSATLVGNAYVADVKHFSTINTDQIKTNQSCVRVLSPALPNNYDLEFTIPSSSGGGAAPIVRRVAIDNSPPSEHVIYNLPSGTNIVLVPIRQSNNTPFGTFVVNTGGAQAPTSPNLPVGPPYNACSTTVTLADQVVPEPASEYLQGLYSFEATNLGELVPGNPADDALATALAQSTANYYDQIDKRRKRETLAEFKTVNGFDTPPDVRATFANGGDLGFGRDMHCKKQLASDGLFDIACYVTNYGNILTNDQADADAALAGTAPVATVAMEFSRIENPLGDPAGEFTDTDRVVKFYVYNAAGTALLPSADLDSGVNLRPRPIPQLCMVCHNGVYPGGPTTGAPTFASRNDTKLGSRFIPFDVHYYVFPAARDKTAQQADIKDLNDLVKLQHTQDPTSISATPAIPEVIDGMYTPPPPLPEQDENFVVAGWNSQPIRQGMYRDVVGRTCRTCHVANIFGTNPPSSLPLVFSQSTQLIDVLGKAESRICTQHVMPHAIVPHRLFWTSTGPSMPAQFQVFGDTFDNPTNGWNGTLCGAFTPGGGTPIAFYTSNIQTIWDGVGTGAAACTGCHTGGASAPAGLDLSSGASYGNIFNVNSTELPSMKRIKPSDAANSYLLHKVNGTQGSVGGSGSRMPQGCSGSSCLSAATRTVIENWINSGAPGP